MFIDILIYIIYHISMVYLYLDKNIVKLIYLKKTLLGQQETSFFEKKYETDFMDKGAVINVDLLASAIKEAFTASSDRAVADNQVFLILPQESFYFLRTQVPVDIAPSAMNSFIYDKARATFPVSPEDCLVASYVRETPGEKVITFFGINKETFENYRQALALIDLRIQTVIPESLAFFKLFEKTLRNEKKENILYLTLESSHLSGYLFDSYGLVDDKKFSAAMKPEEKVEDVIKVKVEDLKKNGVKLNRIILSGDPSDKVRQDTFTKSVGVWTNPLKRIVPTFYDEYLKLLVVEGKKPFPLLVFDVCFGGFIFASENKDITFLKSNFKSKVKRSISLPKLSLPKKEVFIFFVSFALSFLLFFVVSKIKLPDFSKKLAVVSATPTPVPTSTPTPTPTFKKEDLKIKILNGGGVKGKATDVKDILKNKGYGEIITANADNFDYVKTEVQIKKSKAEAFSMLQADLKDYVTLSKQTVLSEDSTADLILVIGQDFK